MWPDSAHLPSSEGSPENTISPLGGGELQALSCCGSYRSRLRSRAAPCLACCLRSPHARARGAFTLRAYCLRDRHSQNCLPPAEPSHPALYFALAQAYTCFCCLTVNL
ncbi:hypothetical protein NDU88_004892 [Pleurodeles waltl]|uniref:Uncharacterized protein n=1 Tax=Pleurodeles waltl TaxID=8319 RepID=A0AAV7PM63_PLEWA|nr:hypothetical protein NDU88_004892 [Pleurodeles waltl]